MILKVGDFFKHNQEYALIKIVEINNDKIIAKFVKHINNDLIGETITIPNEQSYHDKIINQLEPFPQANTAIWRKLNET